MVRGQRLFKCDDCKKVFWGLDIEYMCTAFSYPVSCPRCGKSHTWPLLGLGGKYTYNQYGSILKKTMTIKTKSELMHIL